MKLCGIVDHFVFFIICIFSRCAVAILGYSYVRAVLVICVTAALGISVCFISDNRLSPAETGDCLIEGIRNGTRCKAFFGKAAAVTVFLREEE